MMSIQAILFDIGNTLTATASLARSLTDLRNSTLAQELKLDGQQLLNLDEVIERSIGKLYADNTLNQSHWLDVWKQASTQMGLTLNLVAVEQLCRAHLKQFVSRYRVEPHSISLLTKLKEKTLPLGLVSNVTGPVEIFNTDLRDKGLATYFDVIVWSSAVSLAPCARTRHFTAHAAFD
jgi:FMN phosphatase YigB (HAD superfamily)